jgi:hypothetical protein
MRLLIAIVTLIVVAVSIGVINLVLQSIIGPEFIFLLAGAGFFVWLQIARAAGLVD